MHVFYIMKTSALGAQMNGVMKNLPCRKSMSWANKGLPTYIAVSGNKALSLPEAGAPFKSETP